eukprot:1284125-Pleurochrysis_carterae.AAC.1
MGPAAAPRARAQTTRQPLRVQLQQGINTDMLPAVLQGLSSKTATETPHGHTPINKNLLTTMSLMVATPTTTFQAPPADATMLTSILMTRTTRKSKRTVLSAVLTSNQRILRMMMETDSLCEGPDHHHALIRRAHASA